MSGPNAFSMRRAISGVSLALPWRRSESVASAHVQDLRRLRDVQAKGFNDFGSDQAARMGRVFHGHCILLMVVDQVNIAGGVRVLVSKNQAPVFGHVQAPESLHLAL